MLKITNLSKTYGTGETATQAIADLSFEVNRGEFVCIVGPSGCGKTTLLKTMSGLLPATAARSSWTASRSRLRPSRWRWCSRTTAARCIRG